MKTTFGKPGIYHKSVILPIIIPQVSRLNILENSTRRKWWYIYVYKSFFALYS